MKLPVNLYSPAYPAAWLLFVMLFALAAAHLLAFPWPRAATIAAYTLPVAWVSLLAWREQRHVLAFTAIDWLFAGFVLLVVASLVLGSGASGGARQHPYYLPFLVVIPYLCGRLMRVQDIALLSRIILWAGVAILPLLLLNRLTSADHESGRLAFFGHDHGALMVACLLAVVLVVLCVRILDFPNHGERNRRDRFVQYSLLGIVTVVLVWTTGRGWLLAGLVGGAVTCLFARHRTIAMRGGLLAAMLVVAGGSVVMLPKLDASFGGALYAKMLDKDSHAAFSGATGPIATGPIATGPIATGPILGEASCQPFKENNNSIVIRLVMYREAVAMFLENPVMGVGADRFGERSCIGPGWFPHSTILQAFAELGALGGGLLVGLLAFAGVTQVRPLLSVRSVADWPINAFVLALFATFLVADQIYGNYFMAVGVSLMLGVTANLRAQGLRDGSRG